MRSHSDSMNTAPKLDSKQAIEVLASFVANRGGDFNEAAIALSVLRKLAALAPPSGEGVVGSSECRNAKSMRDTKASHHPAVRARGISHA